ncbi:hypothetical protein UlMin_016347 [Ulmus minor]
MIILTKNIRRCRETSLGRLCKQLYIVKTTNPKKYCVRPNIGIVLPRSTCNVIVATLNPFFLFTMQAQKEAPSDMQYKDKFLLQIVKVNDGRNAKDINAEMFKVVYVSPPQPLSLVAEGSEEGSSLRGSVSENGHVNGSEFSNETFVLSSIPLFIALTLRNSRVLWEKLSNTKHKKKGFKVAIITLHVDRGKTTPMLGRTQYFLGLVVFT